MRIYTGLIKDLGCRCFYYNSGMNIPIGFVCAEIPDIVSILMSRKGLPHFYEHIAIKCNITKDCAIDYVNNFHHIANNDNIELVLRMAKLSDKLNMMNIDDYYENYISFVMSRFNGIMDSYDVYNSISVDDVRDMVKDITEDKLIIQYCS